MYFRTIFVSLLLVLMPLAGFAQKTPSTAAPTETQQHYGQPMHSFPFMGMGSRMQVDHSLNILQRDLALTDSQVSQIRQLVDSRRSRFESIREQAAPKFRELMSLLNRPDPDPTAVGKAAIAFKQVHDQARTEQANLEKEFLNVLNDNQRRTVNSLRSQAPEFMALYRLGFLRPDTDWDQQALNFGR
jgi:Spy/CpxP family protein refolding chaperone